jgi:hypothetical protein
MGSTMESTSFRLRRVAPPVKSMKMPASTTKLVRLKPPPYEGKVFWRRTMEAMPASMPIPAFLRMTSVMASSAGLSYFVLEDCS